MSELPPGDCAAATELLVEKLEGVFAEAAVLSSEQKVWLHGYVLGVAHGVRSALGAAQALNEGGSFEESLDRFYTSLAVRFDLAFAEVRRGELP